MPVSKAAEKFPHYHRPIPDGAETMDVYRYLFMFDVTHPCAQHAIKKLTAAGERGAKSQVVDLLEARDQIDRFIEMLAEDGDAEASAHIEAEQKKEARADIAYADRNRLAIAFAKAAVCAGWEAGYAMDADKPHWDEEWRHVVYVSLPTGEQVSWHMSPTEAPLARELPHYAKPWNGEFLGRTMYWPSLIHVSKDQFDMKNRPGGDNWPSMPGGFVPLSDDRPGVPDANELL